jgi:hypothetical protein
MQQQLLRECVCERGREYREREKESPQHAAAVTERAGVLVLHVSSYYICVLMLLHLASSYCYVCVLMKQQFVPSATDVSWVKRAAERSTC